MAELDRPSVTSLRRASEQRAAEQRAAGRVAAEHQAERCLEVAMHAASAARLEERSYALHEVLEQELDALERRNVENRPALQEEEPGAEPLDPWLLRLVPHPKAPPSPAPDLCIAQSDWLIVANMLWDAADPEQTDPSIPPLRRHIARALGKDMGDKAPETDDDALRCLAALNAYIDKGGLPSVEDVDATPDADPMLRDLLATRPPHNAPPFRRGMQATRDTYDDELQHIRRLTVEAALAGRVFPAHDRKLIDVTQDIHRRRLTGFCISGGGIRSATFGLGLIQAIAEHGFLSRFDYLSTVSGGGYIGGWLSAWIRHEGRDAVEAKLREPPASPTQAEPAPIGHLRSYSNYLSPRVGMFSADTWTLVATYLRNLLLMWLILIPLLASAVLVPRVALAVIRLSALAGREWLVLLPIAIVGLVLGAVAVRFVHGNRPERDRHGMLDPMAPPAQRDQMAFLRKCLGPLTVSTILLTSVWAWFSRSNPQVRDLSSGFGLLFALAGSLVHFLGWASTRRHGAATREAGTILLTGAFAGLLAYVITSVLTAVDGSWQAAELYVVLATPTLLVVVMLMNQLYIGFVSRDPLKLDDAEREWAARFNAWILIVATGWIGWSSLVLIAPLYITQVHWSSVLATSGISGWITAHLGQRDPGKKPGADASSGEQMKFFGARIGLGLAAPIFVVSFVVLVSWIDAWVIAQVSVWPEDLEGLPVVELARYGSLGVTAGLAIVFFLLAMLIARRIDSNKFSLHAMYRMRLIRAYLGASRRPKERAPDPFTGFDEDDNLPMSDLKPGDTPDRPLHLVNVALNLTSSTRLAWQERKAESFTISPLHAGSAQLGYRRTAMGPAQMTVADAIEGVRDCDAAVDTPVTERALRDAELLAPRIYGGPGGITLGTAITISGAAASPNMGYHSSPAITFLMTLFNARLGWWLGNPGPAGHETFHLTSPTDPVQPIVDELFGHTDDRRPYVYLSDGGHFENLGLYELVRRRCRFILVSDAGCDPTCGLEDVGNAIRKVRVDLGVPIDFEPGSFDIRARSADGSPVSGKYWAIGRIAYSVVDAPHGMPADEARATYDGTLVYLKPCFYGTEPRDVFNYALAHPDFPHEPTSDQWFSESQFESYRSLGEHIGHQLFGNENVLDLMRGVYPESRFRSPAAVSKDGPQVHTTVTAGGTITTITT